MSTTEVRSSDAARSAGIARVDMKLEVVVIPVSDVDRAKEFLTEIDGLDIHFIHVRSKHENALPLIVTHGWPVLITEQMKIIDPLTNPTAHGGKASDAFHLVIPSMPGYGFSGGRLRPDGIQPTLLAPGPH